MKINLLKTLFLIIKRTALSKAKIREDLKPRRGKYILSWYGLQFVAMHAQLHDDALYSVQWQAWISLLPTSYKMINHDPLTESMTGLNSDVIVNLSPNQPRNDFPSSFFGKKQYKFNACWYENYCWLEYSTSFDSAHYFCCRSFGTLVKLFLAKLLQSRIYC